MDILLLSEQIPEEKSKFFSPAGPSGNHNSSFLWQLSFFDPYQADKKGRQQHQVGKSSSHQCKRCKPAKRLGSAKAT